MTHVNESRQRFEDRYMKPENTLTDCRIKRLVYQEKDFIFLVSDKKREQWACVTIPNVLFHIPIEMKEIGKLLNQKWLEESQKRSS